MAICQHINVQLDCHVHQASRGILSENSSRFSVASSRIVLKIRESSKRGMQKFSHKEEQVMGEARMRKEFTNFCLPRVGTLPYSAFN
jgi:hypothetical protein